VAGIKGSYTKESLVGKQVVVLTNIDPATLRGVESQGMILAASDETGISVLTTDKPVKLGSIVK
jgi:methionyl-tRNA synthetase